MSTLTDLHRFVLRHHLLPDGAGVIVGVSGGPDSLALLHALGRLAPSHGWWLHAAYLNHGLRREAGEEARFVAEVAAAWGWGSTIEKADVAAAAARPGVSLEEAARQLRYDFLVRVASRLGVDRVAVGHNADDQAETVLMHLLRGSGLAGLRGMLPATPLSGLRTPALAAPRLDAGDMVIVRPWLETPRQAIVDYCEAQSLQPRYDATNTDKTFFRNRLRHEVVPSLTRINPNLVRVLGHTAAALQGDYDSLSLQRDDLWHTAAITGARQIRLDLLRLRSMPRGDQRALLRRAIAHLRPELRTIHWEHTERLLDLLAGDHDSGGPYPLVAGVEAWLNYDSLDIIGDGLAAQAQPQVTGRSELALPGVLELGPDWRLAGRRVSWAAEDLAPWEGGADPGRIWLPMEIPQPLVIRPRQTGDRLKVLGLDGSKPIADLMTELKLPRAARSGWPLLTAADGEVLWVVGRKVGEACRVPRGADSAWEIRLAPTGSVDSGVVAAK